MLLLSWGLLFVVLVLILIWLFHWALFAHYILQLKYINNIKAYFIGFFKDFNKVMNQMNRRDSSNHLFFVD